MPSLTPLRLLAHLPSAAHRPFSATLAGGPILALQAVATLYHATLRHTPHGTFATRLTTTTPRWPTAWAEWRLPWPWDSTQTHPHLGAMILAHPATPADAATVRPTICPDTRLDVVCLGTRIADAWAGTATLLLDPQGRPCRIADRPQQPCLTVRLSEAFIESFTRAPALAALRRTFDPTHADAPAQALLHLAWITPVLFGLMLYNRRAMFVCAERTPLPHPTTPAQSAPLLRFHLPPPGRVEAN